MYDLELLAICYALKSLHYFNTSGLHFSVLSDCAALNSIQDIDLNSIDSNRTLRAVEGIFSHSFLYTCQA